MMNLSHVKFQDINNFCHLQSASFKCHSRLFWLYKFKMCHQFGSHPLKHQNLICHFTFKNLDIHNNPKPKYLPLNCCFFYYLLSSYIHLFPQTDKNNNQKILDIIILFINIIDTIDISHPLYLMRNKKGLNHHKTKEFLTLF